VTELLLGDRSGIERAVDLLRSGGLVAVPTETVYGLAADASSPEAVRRVFAAKGRPVDHPLIVHVASVDDLGRWVDEVPADVAVLAAAFWPGPLTLVLRRSRAVADEVTGGRDTVAVRVPAHPLLLAVLAELGPGAGLAAPSANRFGGVSPTTAAHVVADLDGRIDAVLDGGPCQVGVESTILDLGVSPPEVLRPGAVSAVALGSALGRSVGSWAGDGPARAPGMLASHYSPAARVVMVETIDGLADAVRAVGSSSPGGRVGLLGGLALSNTTVDALESALGSAGGTVLELEPAGDAEGFARVLYDRLRQADRLGLAVLVVVPPPAVGLGIAVRDRLARAATP